MALDIYMVGLIVQDMAASLEFYRRLGVAIPEDSAGKTHVEVKMTGGMTFFLDSQPARWAPGADTLPPVSQRVACHPMVLEFYLKDRALLEATYNELVESGAQVYHAPYSTSFGMRFALIYDPDGNTILLSADDSAA